jgi:L-threonylcarbamoyladenylate synthase
MSSLVNVSADIESGIAKLRAGGVVAFPTDTLYALGADATNDEAVVRVFHVKGREADKPLPLFVANAAMAGQIGRLSPAAIALCERYWPGPLTVVVEKRAGFQSLALAGGDTVALRVPDHPVALRVIIGLGKPVTATSANRSGGSDPVSAEDVRSQLRDAVDLVIDGGACPVGAPSTIVDCTAEPPTILREGAIGRDEIERALARSKS